MRRQFQNLNQRFSGFVIILLLIEFVDEFIFSVQIAGWHLVRADLALTYVQIGLILSLPELVSTIIEPILGILGDVWQRRLIIITGGMLFTLAITLFAIAPSFLVLLLAFMLMYPASGAFVSLSQATLMDYEPERHQRNMAVWTFIGSLANVIGPFVLGLAILIGLGWRGMVFSVAILSGITVILLLRQKFPVNPEASKEQEGDAEAEPPLTMRQGFKNAWLALKRREVQRWLILLHFGNLMLDVLFGFLAIYFVDVAKVSDPQAGLAVAVGITVGLLGDFLLIPLLEKFDGLRYLRISAVMEFGLFSVFLLVSGFVPKLILVALIGLFNAGWYSILKGALYTEMKGQSGTVMTVYTLSGFVGSLLPLSIGIAASQYGLDVAMWLILLGPIALLIGLPRIKSSGHIDYWNAAA